MKLHTVTFPTGGSRQLVRTSPGLRASQWTATLVRLLGSGLTLAAILVLSVWAAGNGLHDALAALSWILGIAFLALAVDGTGRRAAWQAGSGLALMALGWMCSRLAPEFGILAAWLIAVWILEGLFLRIRN